MGCCKDETESSEEKGRIAIAVLVYFIVAILILIIIKFPVAEKIDNDWKDVASVDAGTQILSRYESQNTSRGRKRSQINPGGGGTEDGYGSQRR